MKPFPASAIDRTPRQRVLIRATNWIGDAVLTMPAVQRLRELDPNAHLSLLCAAKLQDLWQHNPFLDEVIPFHPRPDLRELRRRKFDRAILFPNSFRSAWEAWRAGIPHRIGFAGHQRRWLLTDVVEEPRNEQPVHRPITVDGKTFTVKHFPTLRHQAERYLDIVSYLGGNRDAVAPRIWVTPGDLPAMTKFLHEGSRPFFGINAGAEFGPAKRWPAERFAEAAKRIGEEFSSRWLIFGGPGDVEIAAGIEKSLRDHFPDDRDVVNVAGRTTLPELCELLTFCKLLLTNDTGPMHVAAALGTPLVAIFGSTSPELTGPMGSKVEVVRRPVECNPCFLRECPIDFRCMNEISVDQVVAAARRLLQHQH